MPNSPNFIAHRPGSRAALYPAAPHLDRSSRQTYTYAKLSPDLWDLIMNKFTLALLGGAALTFAACGSANSDAKSTPESTPAPTTAAAVETAPAPDLSEAPAGTYAVDKGHAYIVFTYSHHGYSTPYVRWKNWDSTLNWDPENPENSSVTVDIKVANVDTGVDIFDEHLQGERWFHAEAYPDISFASTSLTKTSPTTGIMVGDLSMKGVTKPVTLDVTFNKAAFDGRSNSNKLGFSAKGTIKRSDWNMGAGAPSITDDVNLIIEVEYARPAAEE